MALLFVGLFVSCAGSGKMLDASGAPKRRLWEYKKAHFNMYSLQQDIQLGEHVQQQQIKSLQKKDNVVDPEAKKHLRLRLQKIVDRLAKVSDIPSLPYEVHLYDKPDVVNAFCLPGGKVGVFTGLFDAKKGLIDIKSDDEIAAVLAHEIAHATQRHVSRRMTTYNGFQVVGGIVSMGLGQGVGGNWAAVFNQVYATGTSLYFPTYSRRHESEADQVGFYYMVKAGYDPQAAIRIWDRASEQLSREGKPSNTSFLSTHPGTRDRAALLRAFSADAEEIKKQNHMIAESKKSR